jgi:hypothetical protein
MKKVVSNNLQNAVTERAQQQADFSVIKNKMVVFLSNNT